jgi:hypothetical protein
METNQNKYSSINPIIDEMLRGIEELNLEIKDVVMHDIENRNLPSPGCGTFLFEPTGTYCCTCTCV